MPRNRRRFTSKTLRRTTSWGSSPSPHRRPLQSPPPKPCNTVQLDEYDEIDTHGDQLAPDCPGPQPISTLISDLLATAQTCTSDTRACFPCPADCPISRMTRIPLYAMGLSCEPALCRCAVGRFTAQVSKPGQSLHAWSRSKPAVVSRLNRSRVYPDEAHHSPSDAEAAGQLGVRQTGCDGRGHRQCGSREPLMHTAESVAGRRYRTYHRDSQAPAVGE